MGYCNLPANDYFERPIEIQDLKSSVGGYCNVPANDDFAEPTKVPDIRSSHGDDVDTKAIGWMEPVDLWTPLKELRRRYYRDGYVWIKNLIPREDVLDMREQ